MAFSEIGPKGPAITIPLTSPGSRHKVVSFFRLPETLRTLTSAEGAGQGNCGNQIFKINAASDLRVMPYAAGRGNPVPVAPATSFSANQFRGLAYSFRLVVGGTSYQCELNPVGGASIAGATGAITGYLRKHLSTGVYPSFRNYATPATILNQSATGTVLVKSIGHQYGMAVSQMMYSHADEANFISTQAINSQDPGTDFTSTAAPGATGTGRAPVTAVLGIPASASHRTVLAIGDSITAGYGDSSSYNANFGSMARGPIGRAMAGLSDDGYSVGLINLGTDGLTLANLVCLDTNTNAADYRPDILGLVENAIPISTCIMYGLGTNDASASDAVLIQRVEALGVWLRKKCIELGYPSMKIAYRTPPPVTQLSVARAAAVGITISSASDWAGLIAAVPSATNYANIQTITSAHTKMATLTTAALASSVLSANSISVYNTSTSDGYVTNATSERVFTGVGGYGTSDGTHPNNVSNEAEAPALKAFILANL